jgi:hypothetical protein
MLIIDQKAELVLNGDSKKRLISVYKSKGYSPKWKGDTAYFYVDLNDVPTTSREVTFKVRCDYCEKIYTTTAYDYYRVINKESVKKDCCGDKDCKTKKTRETNLMKYGTLRPKIMNCIMVKNDEGEVVKGYKCKECNEEKPLTEFPEDSRSTLKISNKCLSCKEKIGEKYKKERKEYLAKYESEYYEENKQKIKEYKKKWWQDKYLKTTGSKE